MWTVECIDVLDWAASYDGPKFHAMLCDPPYELGFMSRDWDKSGIAFRPETWAALAQHLHPGAFVMAFASSRGWHRLAVAIEDAGMVIQPSIFGWATGQSFPKATRIDTQIDAHGGKNIGWFGPWLREWRKKQGITQKELAKHFPSKTGGLTGCVANWELGHNLPTLEQFNRLVKVLDLPFQTLEEAEREVVGIYIAPDGKPRGTEKGQYRHNWCGTYDPTVTTPATDLARAWVGHRYGGQVLKNALEPIICAQKPWQGKRLDCIVETGAGALNVDGGRISTNGDDPNFRGDRGLGRSRGGLHGESACYSRDEKFAMEEYHQHQGRWPANFTLQHDPGCQRVGVRKVKSDGHYPEQRTPNEIYGGGRGTNIKTGWEDTRVTAETVADWRCTPTCPVRRLGEQSGERSSRPGKTKPTADSSWFTGKYNDGVKYEGDTGTAARFFHQSDWSYEIAEQLALADPVRYQAKASRRERDAGLEGFEAKVRNITEGHGLGPINTSKKGDGGVRENKPARNPHPTVKPVALTRWLATLLLPPPEYAPRRLLIPFCGTGSEGIGALLAGWDEVVMIDNSAEYCHIATARTKWWAGWSKQAKTTEPKEILQASKDKPELDNEQLELL